MTCNHCDGNVANTDHNPRCPDAGRGYHYLQRKPRKGDRIGFGEFVGGGNGSIAAVQLAKGPTATVDRCDGNLCWITNDGSDLSMPFIWRFESDNTLNRLARIFDTHMAGDQLAETSAP